MDKKPSVVAAIFLPDRKNVLLTMRRDVPVYVLPGGGMEEGETPEEAIIREVKEETGFVVKVVRLVGTYEPINRLARTTLLYECRILEGEAAISKETKEIRFFQLKALPKLLPPPYEEWIFDAALLSYESQKKTLTCVNYKTFLKNLLSHPLLIFRFLLTRMGIYINS